MEKRLPQGRQTIQQAFFMGQAADVMESLAVNPLHSR